MASAKLPLYSTQVHAYQPLHDSNQFQSSSKSKSGLRTAIVVLCLLFSSISFLWFRSHPDFLHELAVAKELSIQAEITVKPYLIPFEQASTPQTPVPEVKDVAILGPTAHREAGVAIVAAASIPAYPRRIDPGENAPRPEEILFAMATSADRAISQARWWLWPSFLSNPSSPCFVLLPPSEKDRVNDVLAEFRHRGLNCIVHVSKQKRYQRRVLSLPMEAMTAMQTAGSAASIKWLIMGDDDTLWVDKRGLQRLLGQHNHQEIVFIASTSERIESIRSFGRMTFGGGGLILSSGLVEKYTENLPECERRWPSTFGGDEAVNNCVAMVRGLPREEAYINEPGMHQFDIYGVASGYLEAGIPMMTLHHFFSWSQLMPPWMHQDDDYRLLHVMIQAAHFLGQDNMFKRYSMEGGRVIVVNGYSITTYLDPLTPEDLSKIEITWGFAPNDVLVYDNMRPPITSIGHRQSKEDRQGKQRKSSYFLHEIIDADDRLATATFVYRNERGKEIRVFWQEKLA